MKKKILLLLSLAAALQLQAKSMVELWNAMPDSVIPYIDRNHRLEMTEFIGMGLSGDVDNGLQGKSKMDTITADYIRLTLNESMVMQLKRLPSVTGDSLLCVVKTWLAPEPESELTLYTQDWQPLEQSQLVGDRPWADWRTALWTRPDTMAVADFDALRTATDLVLVAATLAPQTATITLQGTAPVALAADKPRLKAALPPRTFTWDGRAFR